MKAQERSNTIEMAHGPFMRSMAASSRPSVAEKTERHRLFWERGEASSPLVGFTVGAGPDAWSYWATNPGAAALWNRDEILPEHVDPRAFVDGQRAYLESVSGIDDAFRTAIPFASIPWMEAIIGCRMASTEAQFVSRSFLKCIEEYEPITFDADNPWARKYVEFIEVYRESFGDAHPVGQSVLRGASDLLAALLGPQGAIEALMASPTLAGQVLTDLNVALDQFLRFQRAFIPEFHGGYVIGQYELWSPGVPQRIQEDNVALYSPELYRDFLKPLNVKLAKAVPYTLLHLHSSSLFLFDHFLDIPGVAVFQFSKDEGNRTWRDMLSQLRRVQESERCLLIKGRLEPEDVVQLKQQLTPRGLCIEPVVDSIEEAKEMLPALRSW
jgi:hypothetical protein